MQNPPEQLPPPPPVHPVPSAPHTQIVGQEAAPATAVPQVPPGYVTPGTGPGHTNSAAIISLITAILAPVGHCVAVGGFALIVTSLATGHMALSQIKRTGEDGRGLALAGLIISYVHLAGAVLTVIVFFGAIFAFFAALIGAGATAR